MYNNHFAVQWKLTEHCKSTVPQFLKSILLKFLKTRNNASEWTSAEHDSHKKKGF